MQTFYEVDVHLLKCGGCGKVWHESLPFLPHPMARITKSFARLMIRFRESMSIMDVAAILGLSRQTVREVELAALERKYRCVADGGTSPSSGTSARGGSSTCRGYPPSKARRRSRSLEWCKGEDALKMFASRLRRLKTPPQIERVTMDMSDGYMNFVENSIPDATIVFDHFHVIKMINDRINRIR